MKLRKPAKRVRGVAAKPKRKKRGVTIILLVVLLSVPLKTVLTVRLFDRYASLFLLAKIAMVILMHVC